MLNACGSDHPAFVIHRLVVETTRNIFQGYRIEELQPYIIPKDDNTPLIQSVVFIFLHNGYLYVIGIPEEEQHYVMMFKFCLKTKGWSRVQQFGERPYIKSLVFSQHKLSLVAVRTSVLETDVQMIHIFLLFGKWI
ncbi:hypothetical protein RF11_05100 [Thelohanellus kitauei]|uniref:Uncharacterized protein n=1 Tax=Thelohanellus kitauei TaxID=669202 RepID=A0A0C2IEZ1_THEKT|nr:hypothetical protein RF11_05100 [Thelohanellus kitauei]